MKTAGIFIIFFLAFSSCTTSRRPYYSDYGNYREPVSIQYFYDALSPYGNWVHNREYGYVWIPDVGRNFYPYATNGRWVITDYGWTWVSGYEWGWAPFHYGRWDYDDYYGWFWFPDDQWGPAWVTWRQGNGYYGWAPMGPGTSFGRGMDNMYNDPYRWIFVRDRDFGKGNIVRYNVNPRRNMEILRSSRVINNVVSDNTGRAVYSAGPDPSDVQRSTGRRVSRYEIRDSDRPGTRLNNNQVQIYRPRISANADAGSRPAPSRITDIKDLRPMRERNRNYQPSESSSGMREYTPDVNQGRRQESDSEERARETRRQYEQKQYEMERRKLESEEEQQQRSKEIRENRPVQRNRQVSERKQQTDQQKRVLRREREVRRENAADTARSRRIEREATSRPRRR